MAILLALLIGGLIGYVIGFWRASAWAATEAKGAIKELVQSGYIKPRAE